MKQKEDYLSNLGGGTAVISALAAGVVTHLFALVNVLHNYDDISSMPGGYGAGLTSGRWFLEMLGLVAEKLGLNYNLPFVNGIIFIAMLAVASGFLVDVLGIQDRKISALIGILFVTFPTATSTLYFRFTAIYYGIAIILAILAAWILRRCKLGLGLSALFTALSLGIYQAYTPITIGIFVLLLIQEALEENADMRVVIRNGIYDCIALVLGVILYFILMKISLLYSGNMLSDYRGIDTMGQIALADLPGLIWTAFKTCITLPLWGYCGLAPRSVVKVVYLLIYGISAALLVYSIFVKVKKVSIAVLICLLALVFPVAVNFIVVMCPGNWTYTLMVYSFVLIPCFPLVIIDSLSCREKEYRKAGGVLVKTAAVLVALLAVLNAYFANVSYSAMYYANRQVENYLNSIVTQVRVTEGFDAGKKWVLVGEVDDPLLASPWETELTYEGNGFTEYLLNQYSRMEWIENYIGYSVPMADEEMIAELSAMEEVKQMPCWPDAGSIKVVGDTVVIKFQELNP